MKMGEKQMIEVWIDGLCEPVMPKHARIACLGYVIKEDRKTIDEGHEVIGKGKNMTSNVAEYTALVRALERIRSLELDDEEVVIKSDSNLVVNQMNEEWKVKAENLKRLFDKAKTLADDMDVVFEWIPREKNTEADNLSRIALATACDACMHEQITVYRAPDGTYSQIRGRKEKPE